MRGAFEGAGAGVLQGLSGARGAAGHEGLSLLAPELAR